ncbi:uncharacterized protein LOC143597794 [Bidens hawaiensis]|uniref:uncharacterized protein LOC143597794 n=1 Tax=Bidens hawaiensis TaxID=980011 RepID=UPI00404A696F
MKDPSGNLKGFGFIRFATKDAADKALKELHDSMLDGKKIGVLPSAGNDTLFIGNLNKGWSADDFSKIVHQVFPDVVSVDLAQPPSGSDTARKKIKNRGFGFVKFSSHSAAARALKAGAKPGFVLGGTLHPSIKWAEENAGVDSDELAKITIAFVRNLPFGADETYLKLLFDPFGKVEKVVVHNKGTSTVGFIHFAQRSHLDNAIRGLNGKSVPGPKGGPSFKMLVEVARPMDKKRKRVYEDSQVTQPREILNNYKPQNYESVFSSFNGYREDIIQKEPAVADPHEAAVLLLPVAVRDRLLRILRLGTATRYDIEVESLNNLAEVPESTAILVLDQFMLLGADEHDKRAYLASLISKYQVSKLGLNQPPLNLSRLRDTNVREPVGLGLRAHLSAVDSLALHVDPSVPRSDGYASRYSSLYSDYRLPSHELPGSSTANYSRYLLNSNIPPAHGNMEEMSPNPSHQIPGSSSISYTEDPYRIPAYAKGGVCDVPATRPQMRFDPYTGEPYKFDPFTGEPIVPEAPYENAYRL